MVPKTRVLTFSHSAQGTKAHDPQIIGQEHAQRYYHIRTPLTKKDTVMFRYDLEGYGYGAPLPLDII